MNRPRGVGQLGEEKKITDKKRNKKRKRLEIETKNSLRHPKKDRGFDFQIR